MILQGITINGEYYIAPVYKQLIQKGKVIRGIQVQEVWDLGTPEKTIAFEAFLNLQK